MHIDIEIRAGRVDHEALPIRAGQDLPVEGHGGAPARFMHVQILIRVAGQQVFQGFPQGNGPIIQIVLQIQRPRGQTVRHAVEVRLLLRMQARHREERRARARAGQPVEPGPVAGPGRDQRLQAAHRQQAKRRVEEIHLAPAVVERGLQQDGDRRRRQATGQEQEVETHRRVAQYRAGPGPRAIERARGADAAQQQRERRRGDSEPDGNIGGGRVHTEQRAPAEPIDDARVREGGGGADRLQEAARGIRPEIGPRAVERQRAGDRERAARHQHARPRGAIGGVRKIAGPQDQHGREQQETAHADIGEQAHPDAAQQKRRHRIAAAGPMREAQRRHEHAEKGNVLGVEKGMRVQAGMQQIQTQGQQRPAFAPAQAEGQPGATEPPEQKKPVAQPVAQEMDVAAVLHPQETLRRQERQLEGHAVRADPALRQEAVVLAIPNVIPGGLRDPALEHHIH